MTQRVMQPAGSASHEPRTPAFEPPVGVAGEIKPFKDCITEQAANLSDRSRKGLASSQSRKRPTFKVSDSIKAECRPAFFGNRTAADQPVHRTTGMFSKNHGVITSRFSGLGDPGLVDG